MTVRERASLNFPNIPYCVGQVVASASASLRVKCRQIQLEQPRLAPVTPSSSLLRAQESPASHFLHAIRRATRATEGTAHKLELATIVLQSRVVEQAKFQVSARNGENEKHTRREREQVQSA